MIPPVSEFGVERKRYAFALQATNRVVPMGQIPCEFLDLAILHFGGFLRLPSLVGLGLVVDRILAKDLEIFLRYGKVGGIAGEPAENCCNGVFLPSDIEHTETMGMHKGQSEITLAQFAPELPDAKIALINVDIMED